MGTSARHEWHGVKPGKCVMAAPGDGIETHAEPCGPCRRAATLSSVPRESAPQGAAEAERELEPELLLAVRARHGVERQQVALRVDAKPLGAAAPTFGRLEPIA